VVLPLAALATWSVAAGVTIWQILSIKLELLMQIAPPLWIGVRNDRLSGRRAFVGVALGSLLTVACWALHYDTGSGAVALVVPAGAEASWNDLRAPLGLQAGVWALAVNLLVCLSGSIRRR
jgi:Na+/proline symporter